MRVLVACEFSGIVREAFARQGHDAWSCDLLPTEIPGYHVQGDVLTVLEDNWDLMIAHPPCTHLSSSGARWFKYKQDLQEVALHFFLALLNAPIPQIAVENPIGVVSSRICKSSQIVQPYHFGVRERKATCLWLKCLPELRPTNIVAPSTHDCNNGKVYSHWHDKRRGNKSRGYERSRTFKGLALAMASQWGNSQDYCYRSRVRDRRPASHTLLSPRRSSGYIGSTHGRESMV